MGPLRAEVDAVYRKDVDREEQEALVRFQKIESDAIFFLSFVPCFVEYTKDAKQLDQVKKHVDAGRVPAFAKALRSRFQSLKVNDRYLAFFRQYTVFIVTADNLISS